MQALQGELTVARLQHITANLSDYWRTLCGEIRFLDKRIEMILDCKVVEEAINVHMGGATPYNDMLKIVRLSMVTLESQLGIPNIQRLLEAYPLQFIAALTGVYNNREDWIQGEEVDEVELLAMFFLILSMDRQVMFDRDEQGQPLLDLPMCLDDALRYATDCGIDELGVSGIAENARKILDDFAGEMILDETLDMEAVALVEEPAE